MNLFCLEFRIPVSGIFSMDRTGTGDQRVWNVCNENGWNFIFANHPVRFNCGLQYAYYEWCCFQFAASGHSSHAFDFAIDFPETAKQVRRHVQL